METSKFKTTIKCLGCLEKVTPFLNQTAGAGNWEVDIQAPEKTLTVSKKNTVTDQAIVKAVEEAGFKIETHN